MISYQIEKHLDIVEFRNVLERSTLAARRPVQDQQRLKSMLDHGNLIITARVDGVLVGVARSLTDFTFCTYLSDLAVDEAWQKKGIGKELIRRTKLETPLAKLILLAAPAAVAYYPKIGMAHFPQCYVLDDLGSLE